MNNIDKSIYAKKAIDLFKEGYNCSQAVLATFAEELGITVQAVSENIKKLVKGLMIESYLEDGAQSADEHIFGKSITDPCLGWEKTENLILDIADKL